MDQQRGGDVRAAAVRRQDGRSIRLLFAGYAPVHFVCFRPIYQRLAQIDGLALYVSGGLRSERNGRVRHSAAALYRPFSLPRESVLELDRMRKRRFAMTFCAHTSGYFPTRRCPRVQIFHGVSFRNASLKEGQRSYDWYFLAGPYMKQAFAKRGLLGARDRRGLPIGVPKLDRLVDGSLDRPEILRRVGLRGNRPVLLYAPTGKKHNSLETMGEEVLRRLARTRRYNILVKPHDHSSRKIDWFRRLAPLEGPNLRLVRDPDVVPAMFVADLLLTDASSVAFEYCLLDRPIVFLDVPRLLARARRRAALDLTTHGRKVGVTVRTARQVPEAVRWCLDHPQHRTRARRRAARDLFYDPGGATDRAVAWILETLGA